MFDLSSFVASCPGVPPEAVALYNDVLATADVGEAYTRNCRVLSALLKAFQESPSAAAGPLRSTCRNHFILAMHAGCLEDCSRQLVRCFGAVMQLSRGGSQAALGVLVFIVNLLMKGYYRLRNAKMGEHLIKAVVETLSGNDALESLPKADAVTFLYYQGRYAMAKGKYGDAESLLGQALGWCLDACHQRRILIHLIPLRIVVRGLLPGAQLLARHGLDGEFGPLIEALRSSSLGSFAAYIDRHAAFFLGHELFLLFSLDVQSLMHQWFIRRVHQSDRSADPSRMSLVELQAAFAWRGAAVPMDQLECVVANLIAKGLIRGYIAAERPVLVLSRRQPFPAAIE